MSRKRQVVAFLTIALLAPWWYYWWRNTCLHGDLCAVPCIGKTTTTTAAEANRPVELTCGIPPYSLHGRYAGAKLQRHPFPTECPCAYTTTNTTTCHRHPSMCSATKHAAFCPFTLRNVIVTSEGGLIDCETAAPLLFTHASMGKVDEPGGNHKTYLKWTRYYTNATDAFLHGPFAKQRAAGKPVSLPVYDVVVPTRTLWDSKFTHAAFQAVPLLALAQLAYGPTSSARWRALTWHASMPTAALLLLLGVPRGRIVVGRTVLARDLRLPWAQQWAPPLTSLWRGVAAGVCKAITHNLLALPFAEYGYCDERCQRTPVPPSNAPNTSSTTALPTSGKRLVVYLSRPQTATRYVTNEGEILAALRTHLHPSLELAVLHSTVDFHSIKRMHMSWVRYASALARAKVVIAPHGGALNNLIFAAPDADVIEFNELPAPVQDANTSLAAAAAGQHLPQTSPTRQCFLNAHWAKGGTGRFYVVPPSRRTADFYEGSMRVAVRDVLEVLRRTGALRPGTDLAQYPHEVRALWAASSSRANTYSNRMGSGTKIHYRRRASRNRSNG